MSVKFIQGIPLTRFRELIGLFMKEGFNLEKTKDWKELKRHFFNEAGKELEDE